MRRGLQILLVAVATHYVILVATRILNRSFQQRLPELSAGIFVALVLMAGAALRARPARMALEADRALGLKDRLASFLDLGDRPNVDDRYRRAQAAETTATLAGVDAKNVVVVSRWLWLALPFFLWMIYTSYFSFFLPQPLQWVRQFRVAVGRGAGGSAPDGSSPGREVPGSGPPKGSEAGRPDPKPAGETAAPPARPPQKPHPDGPRGAADPSETAGPAGSDQTGGGSGAGGIANLPQPARLFSAPVGAGLTPVGETTAGTAAKGGGSADTAPRGRVAFNLVPGRGAGSGLLGPGSGQGTGKEGGLRIEVDFAAISPEVRENVRRYFDELSSLFTGGSLGTH